MGANWRAMEQREGPNRGRPTGEEEPPVLAKKPPTGDLALEKHYSVWELVQLWGLSEKTIRRMFCDEPGVVKWGREESRFKRAYTTLRIPESVVHRVHRRLRQTG
jgi:hypothetical protein